MLAHSPPFPLVIDYRDKYRDMTVEDEEEIIFAFKQRDRVLRVRLLTPVMSLRKFIAAMDDEYPILEFLAIEPPIEDKSTISMFPETLQAPHLRSLSLIGFALPTRAPTSVLLLSRTFSPCAVVRVRAQPHHWISGQMRSKGGWQEP